MVERNEDEHNYTEAFERHNELVQRLAAGDLHALDSLIEAIAGVQVVASRAITPVR